MKKFGFLIMAALFALLLLAWDHYKYWSGPFEFLKERENLYWALALFSTVGILNILTRVFPSKFSNFWQQVFSNIKSWSFIITLLLTIALFTLYYFFSYSFPDIIFNILATLLSLLCLHRLLASTSIYKAVVGEVSYKRAGWIEKLSTKEGITASLRSINLKVLIGCVAIAAIGFASYYSYSNRPVPKEEERLSFSLEKPSETRISKNSNGEIKEYISPLQINFNKSTAPLELVGKTLEKGLPRLFPETSGKWSWVSDQRLVFKPTTKWSIGTKYHFKISDLQLPKRYIKEKKEDEFGITSLKASVTKNEFYEDPRDPKVNKVIFSLDFNYPINQTQFKDFPILKKIEYSKSSKKGDRGQVVTSETPVKYNIVFDELGYKAHIHSEALSIPEQSARVTLKLPAGLKSSFQGTSTDYQVESHVDLPGMYNYFNLQDANLSIIENTEGIPEHIGVLQFSTGVKPSALKNKIKIYELPEKKKVGGNDITHWAQHEGLALGLNRTQLTRKSPRFLENSQEFPKLHSFDFDLKPSTYYLLSIEKGIKSASGFVLNGTFEKVIYAGPYPKKLKLMHKGNILSLSGQKKLNIYSGNLKEINVEIGQLLEDQVQHILTQTNGDYTNPRFKNQYQFNEKNLAHFEEFKIDVLNASDKKPSYSSLDFSKYLSRKIQGRKTQGVFFVKITDNENLRLSDQRLIVISDLGVMMKKDVTGEHYFFAQSLSTGKPINQALIQVIGRDGLSISSTRTDSRGYAEVPAIESTPPMGILVKKAEDLAYLRYKDYSTRLDNSRFMVGGISNSKVKNSLRGFLFSDRGIYRPGEEVRIGIIVKSGQWDRSLLNLPVDIVVTNSRGKSIIKKERVLTRYGLDDLIFNLNRGAPTGSYTVNIYTFFKNSRKSKRKNLIGSVDFKVEEFLPDRLKIAALFNKEKVSGWVTPRGLEASVNLQNLFGLPASGNELRAKYKISPVSSLHFSNYKDFRFDNPTKYFSSYSEDLSKKQTDSSGNSKYTLPIEKFSKKIFRLSFFAEGFEKDSGRSVTAKTKALISPYPYLIGLKSIDDYSYIKRDDKRTVEFIAIDSDLNLATPENLTIQFIEKKYVNVLTKRPNGRFEYESQVKKEVLYKNPFKINKRSKAFKLDTKRAGDFIVEIRDENETIFSSFDYTVIGQRDLSRSLSRNAELKIKLNKKDYLQGDTIELEIRSAYTGRGLITIERDKVYDFIWFNQNKKTTTQRIVIPSDLEGNAYVNITLLRSQYSDQIYTTPLSHGVEPFTISKNSRREHIELGVRDLYKPGEEIQISYSTSGKSKVILYAVNEGILQFANYKMPGPLDYYFRKKSLQVNTYQILDRLLPEYGKAVKSLAPGGGYGAISEQLNPFNRKLKKPVAYWSGVLDSEPRKRFWSFKVPEHFNGLIKFFAVAVGKQTLGSVADKTYVRADMILTPNVPTFAAPGDQFDIPVGIYNNIMDKKDAHDIQVSTSHSDNIELKAIKDTTLNISAKKDETQIYALEALQKLGNASITFKATNGSLNNAITETMSIRPASAYSTDFEMGILTDSSLEIPIERRVYSQFYEGEVSLGLSPSVLSEYLVGLLKGNPYGCSEQLISKAFPHLLTGLKNKKIKQSAQEYVEKTIQLLRSRQNSNGSIKLYPSSLNYSKFATLYTLHFLIEADDRGLKVDRSFKIRIAQFIKNSLNQMDSTYLKGYAIYLLTRSEIITTPFLSDINPTVERILADMKNKKSIGKGDHLTLLHVASSYKLLMNEKKAQELLKNFSINTIDSDHYGSYYNPIIQRMRIIGLIAKHFPKLAAQFDPSELMELFKENKRHFNTLSSSFALLGFEELRKLLNKSLAKNFIVKQGLEDKSGTVSFEQLKGVDGKFKINHKAKKLLIENKGAAPLFWSFYHSGFSLPGYESKSHGIEVTKQFLDQNGKEISDVKQGNIVTVKLQFRTTIAKSIKDAAIVDLLPAGFENVTSEESQGSLGYSSDYTNVREDRVISYGKITDKLQAFSYKIKAVNTGRFQVPATLVEDLYDRENRALGKSMKIKITK